MFNLLAIPVAINLGETAIALLDVISLVAILVAVIIGAVKGFIKQIFSILGWVFAIIIASMVADDVSLFINDKIPAIPNFISTKITELFSLDGMLFTGTKEDILNFLSSTKIPEFLHEILAEAIFKSAGDVNIVSVLTEWALTAFSFVIVFVACFILISLLKKLFSALTKIAIIGAVDRVLGALFSALKVFVTIIIIIIVASLIFDMNALLSPVVDGVAIKCYLNESIRFITNLDFIKNLIAF